MRGRGKAMLWAAAALVFGLSATATYLQSFAAFVPYDDEGYMMLSVRHLLDGRRLYAEIQVFYGPLYYLEKWVIHGLGRVPLTHSAVRFTAMGMRLATAVVAAGAVSRITRSMSLALLTFFAVDVHLLRLVAEPGHPQELAVLLVAALPLAAAFVSRHPGRTTCTLGLLIAAVLMVKVNVGVFAALAVWLALLGSMPAGSGVRLLRATGLLATIALPWVIIQMHPDWISFAGIVSASILALAPSALLTRDDGLRMTHVWIFLLAAVTGVAALALFALARGASIGAMLDVLVIRPRLLARDFIFPMPVAREAWGVAAAGVIGSLAWIALVARGASVTRRPWTIAALTLPPVAYALLRLSHDDTIALSTVVAPFAWVVLLPGPEGARPWAELLPRLVLAWLAVLQPLQAFPVPGAQLACGSLPGLLCAMVALGDEIALGAHVARAAARPQAFALARCLLVAGAIAGSWRAFVTSRHLYGAGERLGLPGTRHMHVVKGTTVGLRELVEVVRKRCGVVLTVPGLHSLNFWANRWPPTVDLVPHEFRLLPDERVTAIAAALQLVPSACVVRGPTLSTQPPDPRLETRIMPFFHRDGDFGPYTLFVR